MGLILYFFFMLVTAFAHNAFQDGIADFKEDGKVSKIPVKCDSQANYALDFTQLDISPYPLTENSNFTVNIKANGYRDANLNTLDMFIKVGYIKIPLYYAVPDQFKRIQNGETIEQTEVYYPPRIPIPLNENEVTILLLDQSGYLQYCGKTTASISGSALSGQGPGRVYKCEAKEYEVEIKKLKVHFNQLQPEFEAILKTEKDLLLSGIEVSDLSNNKSQVELNRMCREDSECEITFELSSTANFKERTIVMRLLGSKGEEVGCYYTDMNSSNFAVAKTQS